MAQELEANRKAEAAKRDADYKLALEQAQKAREAMADAERRRAEAEAAAEVARKAAQATVAEREQKLTTSPAPPVAVAALPDGNKKSAERSVGSDEPDAMTQSMQKELKRVGCYSGEVDGKWGEGTRDAIQEFADESKMVLSTSQPTEIALNVLAASKAGVCSKSEPSKKSAEKSTRSRKQARSSSGRSSSGKSSGTIIFGVGKGVGVGIGF
jgi:peptidoglycan hydrolase-like protein with peptidoglycan-binding domain